MTHKDLLDELNDGDFGDDDDGDQDNPEPSPEVKEKTGYTWREIEELAGNG